MLMKPQGSLSPRPDVVKQAIDLCAAFGGGNKELVNILKDVLKAQKHNETVLKEANTAYNSADSRIRELEKFKKSFEDETGKQNADLHTREAILHKRIQDFDDKEKGSVARVIYDHRKNKEWAEELSTKERMLAGELDKLDSRENACVVEANKNDSKETSLDTYEMRLKRAVAGAQRLLNKL